MSDMREVFQGRTRKNIDDEHTSRMYSLLAKRTEMLNSMISLLLVGMIFVVAGSVASLVALVIWVWQVLL